MSGASIHALTAAASEAEEALSIAIEHIFLSFTLSIRTKLLIIMLRLDERYVTNALPYSINSDDAADRKVQTPKCPMLNMLTSLIC